MAESPHQHAKAIITTDALEDHAKKKKSFTGELCKVFQSGITLQSGFNGYKYFNIRKGSWTQTEQKMPQKNTQLAA